MSATPENSDSLLEQRKEVSKLTLGASSSVDIKVILKTISSLPLSKEARVMDVGCGNGLLLDGIRDNFPQLDLNGMDLEDFSRDKEKHYQFFMHDLNNDFPKFSDPFDLVICSHVILYLENPRHFIRQIHSILKMSGRLIINNPNVGSWRGVTSMALRGYHFCCPDRFPGHITAPSLEEMNRILVETGFAVKQVSFTDRGRMPGGSLEWQSVLPFLKGKRFSDAYSILVEKVGN